PVIRVAEPTPRALDPIVDPWVEEYETTRAPAAQSSRAPEPQGDLYAARSPEPAVDDYDDRDHRRSGWSLFGRGKRAQPQPEPTYSPRPTSQMRSAAQPQAQAEPETGHADDDLEIPSFLRRLAN
ncbi:MAG: cell division protein FtsZ, partial [Alphaproteobacteria bacterium]